MHRLLACALLLAAPGAGAAELDAPLAVRTQGTLRELFLDVTLSDARPSSRSSHDLRWAAANTWSTPTTVRSGARSATIWTDEQADSLTLASRLPWSVRGVRGATTIEWRLTEHWGGWSDPVISSWHRAIRVYDYQRDRFGRNEVHLRLAAAGDRGAIRIDGPRLAAGDLVLRNQLTLARGGVAPGAASGAAPDPRDRWAFALRVDLKAPTGALADAGGSGGWDAATALVATAALTPWSTLHGLVAASALSRLPAAAGIQPRRLQLGGEISLVLHGDRWALVLEDRLRSPLFEGGWRLSGSTNTRRSSALAALFRAQNQVSVGVRRGPLTLWVSEDVTPGGGGDGAQRLYYLSNAPDITVGLAFAWTR